MTEDVKTVLERAIGGFVDSVADGDLDQAERCVRAAFALSILEEVKDAS